MSTPIDDGGPACPLMYCSMTLRDWFAGQALAGLSAKIGKQWTENYPPELAYQIADRMLQERAKEATK